MTKLTEIIQKVVVMALKNAVEKDGPLKEGERFVTVFDDCTVIMEIENGNWKNEIIIGKPYRINAKALALEDSYEVDTAE